MLSLQLPLAEINMMWYAVPLILVISLVYAATHHEAMSAILGHATRLALMISGFMVAIMIALAFIGWRL